MTTPTLWQGDDPCPSCGTTMTLTDNGDGLIRIECRSCGHADFWTTAQPRPDAQQAEAHQASEWLLDEYEQNAAALQAWRDGRLAGKAQEQRARRFFITSPMLCLKDG